MQLLHMTTSQAYTNIHTGNMAVDKIVVSGS